MTTPGPTAAEANIPRVDTLSAPERARAASVVSAPALKRGHEFRTTPAGGQEISGHPAIAERTNEVWRDQRGQDQIWRDRNAAAEQIAQQASTPQEAQQIRDQEFQQQVADWAAHIAGSDVATVESAGIWQGTPEEISNAIAHDPILHRLGFDPDQVTVPGNTTATNQQKLAHWLQTRFYGQYCEEGENGTQRLVEDLMRGADFDNHGNLREEIRTSGFLRTIYGDAGDVQLLDAVRLATEVHARESVYRWPVDAMAAAAAAQGHNLEDRTGATPPGIHEPNVFALLEGHPIQPTPEPPRQPIQPAADVTQRMTQAVDALHTNPSYQHIDLTTPPDPDDTNDPRNEHYFAHPAVPLAEVTDAQVGRLFPTDRPINGDTLEEEAALYGGITPETRAQALLAADRLIIDALTEETPDAQRERFTELLTQLQTWTREVHFSDPNQPTVRTSILQDLVIDQVGAFRNGHQGPFADRAELEAALQQQTGAMVLRIADGSQQPPAQLAGRENLVTITLADNTTIILEIDRDATVNRWVEAHTRINESLQQGQITAEDQAIVNLWAETIDHQALWTILHEEQPAPTPEPHRTETVRPDPTLVQAMTASVDRFQTQSGINISAAPRPGDVREAHFRAEPLTGFVEIPQDIDQWLAEGEPLFQPGSAPGSLRLNEAIAEYIHDLSEAYNVNAAHGGPNVEQLEALYDNLGSSLAAAAAVYGGTTPESRAMYLLNAYNLVLETYGTDPAQRADAFRAMIDAQIAQVIPVRVPTPGNPAGEFHMVDTSVLTQIYLPHELALINRAYPDPNNPPPLDELLHPDPSSGRMFAIRVRPLTNLNDFDATTHKIISQNPPYIAEIDIDATVALWNSRFDAIQERIHQGQITPADARQITIWSDGVRQDEIIEYLATAQVAVPESGSDINRPTLRADQQREVTRLTGEIYTAVQNRERSEEQFRELVTEAQRVLQTEHDRNDAMGATIAATEALLTDETRARLLHRGEVVYIPQGDGQIVAIGDVHGDLASVIHTLQDVGFLENMVTSHNMQLVFLGDLVDRGPHSLEMMELVLDLKRRYPENVTILHADHESRTDRIANGDTGLELEFSRRFAQTQMIFGPSYTPSAQEDVIIHRLVDNQLVRLQAEYTALGLTEADVTNYRRALYDYNLAQLRGDRDGATDAERIMTEIQRRSHPFTIQRGTGTLQRGWTDMRVNTNLKDALKTSLPQLMRNPLYMQLTSTIDLLPRAAFAGGAERAFVHGGLYPDTTLNIETLANLPADRIEHIMDSSMAWADLFPDTADYDAIYNQQLAELQSYLPQMTGANRAALEQHIARFQSQQGYLVFNPKRTGDDLLAAVSMGFYQLTQRAIDRSLQAVGAVQVVRGHEQDTGVSMNGHVLTLHQTGSNQSPDAGMRISSTPSYGVFSRRSPGNPNDAIHPVWTAPQP